MGDEKATVVYLATSKRYGKNIDNRISNLRYGTYKENSKDCIKHGTIRRGAQNHNSVLTEEAVRFIRSNRGLVAIKIMAKKFKVTKNTIQRAMNGETWKHI